MNIMQAIAKRAYLATDAQIIELAKAKLDATDTISGTEFTYLRVLVAGAQSELGMTPRVRIARKVEPIEQPQALEAIEKVHQHYYKLVMEAITTPDVEDKPTLKKGEKARRAIERNRRSNYARTSVSLLRAYVKAGGNITSVVVPTVTKAQLRSVVDAAKPAPSKEAVAERLVSSVIDRLQAVREENPKAADTAVQQLLTQLAQMDCGDKTTTSPKKAMEEGLPLKLSQGLFLPIPNVPTKQIDGQAVTIQ